MIMAIKRMLWAVLVVYLVSHIGIASAQSEGNVLINSDPQGSLVLLEGDLSLSGVAPVRFDRVLSGRYTIEVNREGYENYHSVAYFSETQMSQVDIRLVRKTRTKAMLRSLFIPGWGQRYYGSKTKSTLFAIGTAASAIGFVLVKDDYDSKMDNYEETVARRDAADKWSEIPELDALVREEQERANDAETKLNIFKATVIGIYAWNVLDAFFFFPEFTAYTEYKAITARPQLDGEQIGLSISMRF